MNHIAQLIQKSSFVRIFLAIVLSLGMAWLLGSGWHTSAATNANELNQKPLAAGRAVTNGSALAKNTVSSSTSSQASVASANNNSLDKAVRMLGGVDREHNTTGGSTVAKTTTTTNTATSNNTAAKVQTDSTQNQNAVTDTNTRPLNSPKLAPNK
jgi:hypothetical protein